MEERYILMLTFEMVLVVFIK